MHAELRILVGYAAAVLALGLILDQAHRSSGDVRGLVRLPDVPLEAPASPRLLTGPYLQAPEPAAVHVRWLSNIPSGQHRVLLAPTDLDVKPDMAPPGDVRAIQASAVQVPMLFEDAASRIPDPPARPHQVLVFRHEARVDGLEPGLRYPYWIESVDGGGARLVDGPYHLRAAPDPAAPVTLLLTSDFQQRPRALAGLAEAARRFPDLDGVVFAGDLVHHPRRASHWFQHHRDGWSELPPGTVQPSFFDALQGNHRAIDPAAPWPGGGLLQRTPLYPVVGNHEISGQMLLGRRGADGAWIGIAEMYNRPQPRWAAPITGVPAAGARDGFDFETYRALFRPPLTGDPAAGYYATRIGEVFLVSLNASRIWRPWRTRAGVPSKYEEPAVALNNPALRGWGSFMFERLDAEAPQVAWLKQVLASEEARSARYRVAVLHQSVFGLGDNVVPLLVDPEVVALRDGPDGERLETRLTLPADPAARARAIARYVDGADGPPRALRYRYPRQRDLFAQVIAPILDEAGVDLVVQGHSHIWNRSSDQRLALLETSHLGNCFGAFWTTPAGTPWRQARRALPRRLSGPDYPRTGDPWERAPIYPNLRHPMMETGESDRPVPFVCSDKLSIFSVLDSEAQVVRSFAVDATDPSAEAFEFDRLRLGGGAGGSSD